MRDYEMNVTARLAIVAVFLFCFLALVTARCNENEKSSREHVQKMGEMGYVLERDRPAVRGEWVKKGECNDR